MKRLLQISIMTFLILLITQSSYAQLYEMEIRNFTQVSEYELQWDVYIRKPSGSNWALDAVQFQISFNQDLLYGGALDNDYLKLDASDTDIEGPVGENMDKFEVTHVASGTVIQWASGTSLINGQTVTVFDDTQWKKIATFSLENRKDGNFHPFADVDPQFGFREDPTQLYTLVTQTEFSGTQKQGDASPIPIENRTLIPEYGVSIETRQLASYWFTGNGDWTDETKWNQTLKGEYAGYVQSVPSTNANVVINGNVTIPSGTVSLLPDGDGNGGELTVLTGAAALFTLTTLADGNANISTEIYADEAGTIWLDSEAQLAAGTTVYLSTSRSGPAQTFYGWYYEGETSYFTNEDWHEFVMPTGNTTVYAHWSSGNPEFDKNNFEKSDKIKNGKSELFSSLTIASGGALTVDKLFNDHEAGAAAIVIESDDDGTGSLIANNEGVAATMQRYFPGASLNWHLLSAPVNDMLITGSAFEPRHEEVIKDDFYMWHESGWWLNYKTGESGNFFEINPGFNFVSPRGYLVAYDFDVTKDNPTKNFVGTLNAGNVTFTLVYDGDDLKTFEEQPHFFNKYGWEFKNGWNLIGNPYPSGINWNLANKSAFQDNIAYVYQTGATGHGITEGYKPIDGENVDAYIGANQGFFVLVNPGNNNTEFNFTNAMRVHEGEFVKSGGSMFDQLKLIVSDEIYYDETAISLKPHGEFGYDRSDALKLFGYSAVVPQLYTLTSDNVLVAINSIPHIKEDFVIPIGMWIPTSNEYTLRIADNTGIFGLTDIYLKDLVTGEEVLLSELGGYTFTADASKNPKGNIRFELRFTPVEDHPTDITNPGTADASRIWCYNNTLYVYSIEEVTIDLFGINGSKLATYQAFKGEQSYRLDLPAGIYVVRMSGQHSVQSHKIVIR